MAIHRGDWLLRFVYRTSSATRKIAGLQPVAWRDRRIHNFDLSSVVGLSEICSHFNELLFFKVRIAELDCGLFIFENIVNYKE